MVVLLVFVKDLPDGKILDDAQVAPFHTVPGYIVTKAGVDPEHPLDRPQVQRLVLDNGVDIPTSLPVAIPELARMHVALEIPAVVPNFGFKAESDGFGAGNYHAMLVLAAMIGFI